MAPRRSGHLIRNKLRGTSTPGMAQVVGDPPSNKTSKQAGAEMCQAQEKLGLAKLDLHFPSKKH